MTSDQDYYQLLDHGTPTTSGGRRGSVWVFNPLKRDVERLVDPDYLTTRYNITPAQFADYRALCGDLSDNIPGVRGIGPKSAADLLRDGFYLEDLLDSDRLNGTKGHAIREAWDQVLTWRAIIRMNTVVPTPPVVTSQACKPLPIPGEVLIKLGLWQPSSKVKGHFSYFGR